MQGTIKMQQSFGRVRTFLFALAGCFLVSGSGNAADWDEGAGSDWTETLAAARIEGEVILAGPAQLADEISKAFTEATGIKARFLGGSNRDIRTKFRREVAAGVPTIDVKIGGSGEIKLANDGLLEPLAPLLMLPSVSDPANWLEDRLKWVDEKQTFMPIPNEYVFGWPVANNTLVAEGVLTSWQDLLRPEFKGKIAAFDPTIPGPGQAAASYLGEKFGEAYLEKLFVGQEVTLVRDGRQMVEWVARGSYAVALGAVSPNVEKFKSAGITTLFVPDLSDGPGSILGGSSIPVIPKGAPHRNAAIVFVNWYLSAEGQTIYGNTWQTPSRRRDVSSDGLPDYVLIKPAREYLDQYQEKWYVTMRSHWSDVLTAMLGK